jgi:heme-degrading monooxygenase HmoA
MTVSDLPWIDGTHHVRLNRFVDMDPGALLMAVPPVRDEIVPAIEELPGCRTVMVGVDLRRGTGTVITFWESDAAMRASATLEAGAREHAMELAGAVMDNGLVDTYDIVLERRVDVPGKGVSARLARWEGVRPHPIRDAVSQFEEHDLPILERMPGFRGLFVATNRLLGNTLSVSLWASPETLSQSLGWEREARTRVEATVGLVPRTVIVDTYQVALEPALRRYSATWYSDAALGYSRSARAAG